MLTLFAFFASLQLQAADFSLLNPILAPTGLSLDQEGNLTPALFLKEMKGADGSTFFDQRFDCIADMTLCMNNVVWMSSVTRDQSGKLSSIDAIRDEGIKTSDSIGIFFGGGLPSITECTNPGIRTCATATKEICENLQAYLGLRLPNPNADEEKRLLKHICATAGAWLKQAE